MHSRSAPETADPPDAADGDREPAGAGGSAVEPDPRFKFANERTYLAWSRTSLALIVGGLAVAQFVKVGVDGIQLILAIPLIAMGAYLSLRSYRHWLLAERALHLAQPLPASTLPRVLVYGIVIAGLAAIVLAILHFTT